MQLTNRGAGHAVPTGMPGRRLILALTIRTDGGQTYEGRRIYTKTFAGADGKPIEQEGRCFAPGVRLLSDTRLRAGETRTETFAFPVAPAAAGTISMKVQYEHAPTSSPENREYLTVLSEERSFAPR